MKYILISLFLLLGYVGVSQNYPTPYTQQGSPGTLVQVRGGQKVDTTRIPPTFVDTNAANLTRARLNAGSEIFTTSDNNKWYRNATATGWILQATTSSNCLGTRLISGFITWSGIGYGYDATDHSYFIGCRSFFASATTLTLSTADPSYPRIDKFVADTLGVLSILTGTPATNPQEPTVNPLSQIDLGFVYVPAGSTTPSCTQVTTIYNEGGVGEWAIASDATVNNAYATNPCYGSVSTLVTSTTGQFVSWQNGSPLTLSDYPYTKLYVKLNGALSGDPSAFLTAYFALGSTQVSSSFQIGNGDYGFDYSSTSCQLLTLPNFNLTYAPGALFDKIVFVVNSPPTTFQLDRIYMLSCAYVPPTPADAWLLRGVSGTDPAINYNGTADSVNFFLGTNGQARLGIAANGIPESSDTTDYILGVPRTGDQLINKRPVPTIYASTCMQFFDSVGKRWIRDTCNHGGSGGDFIQNQYSATQTAEYKISGSANSDSLIVNNIDAAERVFIGDTMAVDKRFIFYGNSVTIYIPLQDHILHRYSYITSETFNAVEDNRAISGTRLVALTVNDSSMWNRLYTVGNYSSGQYFFGMYGINDASAGTDTTTYRTTWEKIIDTLIISRGYPADHVIILPPVINDSFRIATRSAANNKGVPFIDVYTYMRSSGLPVADMFMPDGLHPNVLGQSIIAEGIVTSSTLSSLPMAGVLNVQGYANISGNTYIGKEADVHGGLTVDGDSTFDEHRWISYRKSVASGTTLVGTGVYTDTTMRIFSPQGVSIGKYGYNGTTFTPYLQTFANGRVAASSIDRGFQVQIGGSSASLVTSGRIESDSYINILGDGGASNSTIAGGLTVSSGLTILQGTVINGSNAVGDQKWKLYKNGNSIVSEGVSGSGEYLFNAGVNNFVFNHLSSVDGTTLTPLMTLFRGTGNLALGTTTDVPSSILTLASTTKGMLAPRMTAVQRNAISSPATGLLVFDTDSTSLFQYTGSAWQNLYNTGGGGSGYTPAGNNGNVQINDNGAGGTPASDSLNWNAANARLDVKGEVNATTRVQSGTSIIAGTSLTATTGIFFNGALSSNSQVGTTGQKLTSAGAGVAPTWKDTAAVTGVYLPLAGGTMTGALLFTDNTLDIGASGATRPRTGYFGTSIMSPTIVGGTTTTSPLTLYATTGVAAAGASIIFKGGTNGGTTFGTMSSAGAWDFASGAITTLGNISGNNIIGAGLLRAAAGSAIQWSGRTSMSSSADGIMSITANSGTANTAILNVAAIRTNYVAKTANYTATTTDETISCSTNAFDVTLPTAVGCAGQKYNITNSGAANTITIKTTSSQTFANVTATPTTLSLVGLGAVIVVSDGANWLQLK